MDAGFLNALPPGRHRRLARGEALFHGGDPAVGLVLVREGALELVRALPEGRRLVLHRAGPGDTFAEASLFEARHHCDALAASPSRVTVHPAAELRRAAAAEPGLAWRLAAHLAARLVAERARAERLALPHAADRLLAVLHALPPAPSRPTPAGEVGGAFGDLGMLVPTLLGAVAIAAVATFALNPAVGLAAGWLAELVRSALRPGGRRAGA